MPEDCICSLIIFSNRLNMMHICSFQEGNLGKRHENQKMAAFNLGVSEAVKSKKLARPTEFHVSNHWSIDLDTPNSNPLSYSIHKILHG